MHAEIGCSRPGEAKRMNQVDQAIHPHTRGGRGHLRIPAVLVLICGRNSPDPNIAGQACKYYVAGQAVRDPFPGKCKIRDAGGAAEDGMSHRAICDNPVGSRAAPVPGNARCSASQENGRRP
jgi:hypothetical protein